MSYVFDRYYLLKLCWEGNSSLVTRPSLRFDRRFSANHIHLTNFYLPLSHATFEPYICYYLAADS